MKNNILRSVLFLGCLFAGLQANAQDTIYYKASNSNIVVIVKEVTQTEVKYKKAEMPDGPTYVLNKSDISKIVYKNGYTEVIKEPVAEPASVADQPYTVTYVPSPVNLEKISYDDTKRRNKYMINLIDRHPNPERKPALMSTLSGMKKMKAGQDATRTVGIVFGGVTIVTGAFTALFYAFDSSAGDAILPVPVAAGAIALISTAAAITFNINLRKKRHKFVDQYNQ
ncbi:MAG: hypothetical protein V4677_06110 [Bacteroidota bacterium]